MIEFYIVRIDDDDDDDDSFYVSRYPPSSEVFLCILYENLMKVNFIQTLISFQAFDFLDFV